MAVIKDRSSLEWRQIKEFCDNRIIELNEENELRLGKVDTATVRGKIEQLREILALGEDTHHPDIPDTNYIG